MAQEIIKEQYHTTTTKSGVEIRYEDSKHLYWVRGNQSKKDGLLSDTEWIPCDFSMSGVGDCLAKGGMGWWGMRTGLHAAATLIERNYMRVTDDGKSIVVMAENAWEIPTMENLEYRTKKEKLTVNDTRDKAGERGNSVHKALEAWVESDVLPVPDFYPEVEQGYVRGLLAFLSDLGPLKSKPQSEIMVASVEHRIAGRYDLEAVLHGSRLITKKATPTWQGSKESSHPSAKGPVYKEFKGRTLFDLKTSKDAYLSAKIQMTGYEGCRIECGMPKTDQQLIVNVGDDGTYKVTEADTTWDEFLMCLAIARVTKEKG